VPAVTQTVARSYTTSWDTIDPPIEVEHQLLLVVLGLHVGNNITAGQPPGMDANSADRLRVEAIITIVRVHGIAVVGRTGSGARSKRTGEKSQSRDATAGERRFWTKETLADQHIETEGAV
jgi:hypothetical protein